MILAVLYAPAPVMAAENDLQSGAKSEIDIANMNDGYIRVRSKIKTTKKLKLRTSYSPPGGTKIEYNYDLNGNGVWETYSLQSGNGKYAIIVFESVGTRYSPVQTVNIDVKYSRENAPFLVPAQNVNYTEGSMAVKMAEELCKSAVTDMEKVESIYKFIVETITYDKVKAGKIASGEMTGYLPKINDTLETSKGICFDYSSLFAAMLRSQDIPAKLIMGYVAALPKPSYHAWNEIYIKNVGWIRIRSQVYFSGKDWARMDSTFASGNINGARTKFISKDENYTKDKEY